MARPPGHGPAYEVKRQEIIDVAATLFAKKGYSGTGIAEISEATGTARGALYYYIGSKENLLIEIQNRVMEPLLGAARRIADVDDADPLVKLRMLSQVLLENILARLDHVRVYEHDYKSLRGANRARLLGQRHEFEQLVEEMLTAAMDEGQFRDTDARLATLQFLNLHNHTYQWVRIGGEWDAERLSREYCTTFIYGLRSDDYTDDGLEERFQTLLGRRETSSPEESATPRRPSK